MTSLFLSQIADRYIRSAKGLRRLVDEGAVPHTRDGRRIVIAAQDVPTLVALAPRAAHKLRVAPSRSELEWQSQGSCRGAKVRRLFFGPEHENFKAQRRREAEAKAVCATCPVRTECLDWATTNREQFGVWGGTGQTEREQMWSPKKKAAA